MAIIHWWWRKLGTNTELRSRQARYRKRKWILRSQKYRFKQSNRNAVLLLIGHRKRISLETNLVSENEPAIFSKGRQFRLFASRTAPFLGMQTKMTVKTPAWSSGTARILEWRRNFNLRTALPKFSRELGLVSNLNKSMNWFHRMKDHVEIDHLTKYDVFRTNRDQVMDLEIWFKIQASL